MIQVKDLCFKHQNKVILNNINFIAEKGEIISLLGPNGSGKSTLLKCIVNLLKSNNNKIFIKKKPIEKYSKKELSKHITFLPQMQNITEGISVYELISLGRGDSWVLTKKDKEKINEAIAYMKLEDKVHEKVNSLSGGERQKVFIAMALVRDTSIIIMDEPVTYMDIKNQWELLDVMKDLKKRLNKTIIAVFHDINHSIEVSDMIYLLKKGEIYKKGKPSEVLTKENIKEVYKIDTYIHNRMCNIKKCRKFSVIPLGTEK